MSDAKGKPTVVIGLGNPLMADDGLGLAAVARLQEAWQLPEDVEVVDGGTWGMNLLPVIEDAGRVLLVDAIATGKARPGTLHVLERNQIPRYLATKISPHQVDLRDVLALAELRGTLPAQTVAIGLEPEQVELCNSLTDTLRLRLDELVGEIVALLQGWGLPCSPRESVHA